MPVFKKLDPIDKANFRPVSLLPLLFNVFEKTMDDQLNEYVETFLNKLLLGFGKAYSTQHALFMTERVRLVWNCRNVSNGFI